MTEIASRSPRMPTAFSLAVTSGQAAIFVSPKSVMIQRGGLLDLTSMTEWTSPVTSVPSIVNVVFLPRC
jgi:hypothetical protein